MADLNSRRNSMFLVVGVGVVFALIFLFQYVLGEDEYLLEMDHYRKDRESFLRTNGDSPLPDSLKSGFKGLNFFPVDKEFRVTGKLERNPKFEYYPMAVTGGEPEQYAIAGWVHFNIKGQEYKLRAFQQNPSDLKALFIPFRDATSGKESYGGGRYIDTRLINDDKVLMDFNKAYNPYCVYNYAYVCPIPPPENQLTVAITAGEKNYEIGVKP